MNAAAAVARRASSSEVDVLRAVSDELSGLDLVGGVALLTDGVLRFRTWMLGSGIESALERLTGETISGYQVDLDQLPTYREALETGEAVLVDRFSILLEELLPKRLRPFSSQILKLIGGEMPSIVAPIQSSGKRLGLTNVTAKWLTAEHIPILTAISNHVAIALDQVRTREEMAAALVRERLRNQVAESIASALDLTTVLKRVIELAVEVSGADAGAIGLPDAAMTQVTYPHTYGLPDEVQLTPAPRGQGLAWQIISSGQPILLNEYDGHLNALPSWAGAGLHAFMGIPLLAGEDAIGAMGLFKLRVGQTFEPHQMEAVQSIVHMASMAVRNARLYADAQRRAEELEGLIKTSRSISGSLDLGNVLEMIAEQAKSLLASDGSRIHMLDHDSQTLRCLIAIDPQADALMEMQLTPGTGLVGSVLSSGEPLLMNNPEEDPRSLQVPGTPQDEPECLAMAPLKFRDRSLGVMAVRRIGKDRPFTTDELNILTAFAAHAAVAIENADLYGQIESHALDLELEVQQRTRDLALSEARYRAVVENSQAGIFNLDAEGLIEYANEGCASLLGVERRELLGRSLFEFWAPDQRERAISRHEARAAGIAPAREVEQAEVLCADGETVPILLAISMLFSRHDEPLGSAGLMLDISDRMALERQLQNERDRLDAILSNIGDAVIVTDPDGMVEYVNPGWVLLNGYRFEEVSGRPASFLDSGDNRPHVINDLNSAVRDGRAWQGELVNRRKDGSTYDAMVSITPILDDQGVPISLVGVQHDISALKEIDRLKSQFVSDVSHELRTPLTNIRLYVDLLSRYDRPGRSTEYLETLNRESDRLAHLIDDLLSLSRLESGATDFRAEPVNVNQLLRALYDDRRTLASTRGLDLEMSTDEDLPVTIGDSRLLSQILTNLLTNAMNYTPSGGQIRIQSHTHSENGQVWATASIEDNGLGIQEDELDQIFQRFYRGRASHATGAPGTGLGLAICQEIAEMHGGRISVASHPGRGSTFTIWLPAAQGSSSAGQPSLASSTIRTD